MTRARKDSHMLIEIRREIAKKLNDYKVHPNQSYSEVIAGFLKQEEEKTKGEQSRDEINPASDSQSPKGVKQ